MARILLVEDNPDEAEMTRLVLVHGGHEVDVAVDLRSGGELFRRGEPDLAILDISLPDGSGFELCARIRTTSRVPVLFLTGRTALADKVRAFRAGGDDFLSKPFAVDELLLRVDALLRRAAWSPGPTPVARIGDLEIDAAGRVVRRGGQPVRLSAMELDLVLALASTPGVPWPVDKLARRLGVLGQTPIATSVLMRNKISRIRRKLEPDPRRPRYLHSQRDAGYLLAWRERASAAGDRSG